MERLDLVLDGALAPPRANGELLFDAPWQSRAFGLAALLAREDPAWAETFRQELAAQLTAEPLPPTSNPDVSAYYARWLAALERVMLDSDRISGLELDQRAAEFAHGDHDHH